jgi:hypothetical protein
MSLARRRVVFAATLLVGATTRAVPSARADGSTVEVQVVATISGDSEGVEGNSLKAAPRSGRLAWRVTKSDGTRWAVDGKPGKAYADVGPLVFSEDGEHAAYFARAGDKHVLVWDGIETPVESLAPSEGSLRFVPGGAQVAFVAQLRDALEKSVVVVDGVAGPPLAGVREDTLVFSADGKRHAYLASDGEHDVVVVDGKPSVPYAPGSVVAPRLSADGTRVAWAQKPPEARVVVDGVPGPVFEEVTPPTFAPQGARWWYLGVRKGKPVIVVDGKEDPPVLDLPQPGPVWSPDGSRLGYVAIKEGGWRAVIDGQDGPTFKRMGHGSLRFSPDGKRHAYWAAKGPKPFWVVDGVSQAEVDQVGTGEAFAFSPDSKRFACRVQRRGKWVVLTGGEEGPEVDVFGVNVPVFTPDSAHVVYHARLAGSWHLFVDGKPGPGFDALLDGTLAFGQDGATVAVVGRRGQNHTIVIDGVEAKATYPAMLPGLTLVPDGPRSFRSWFAAETGLVHVRAELKPAAPR